ncbi:MAG TPA: FAD-binding oxidoreductase [Candidatus Dormibacteraeota bacterium]|nr:FAD-binding oxidoreductase [Candidatus Dormibacteraeota bacterium]
MRKQGELTRPSTSNAVAGAIDIRGRDGTEVQLNARLLAALASRLKGDILIPSDPGFDDAARLWNGMVRRRPALIVQPASVADVRETVTFALTNRILLSIKGGGHHAAGLALADGGLTLDMSRLRNVVVEPEPRLALVGAGCRLGDVDRATQDHGLATVLGSDADTGVAGLTLGGGFGSLSRQFGWTVDNLDEVEIVTADGEVHRAAADENEDLFWALRGGGGNFGVVTRFTYRLHPIGPLVTSGLMLWDASVAERVLETYRKVTEAAPRELMVALTMRLAPQADAVPERLRGRPVVGVLACHTGDPARVAHDLAPFRDIEAAVDTIGRKRYVDHQHVMGFPQPAGSHQYWKSEFLPQLRDGFLQAYRRQAEAISSPMSQLILFQLGGAIGDREAGATAMGNRDARYIFLAAGAWSPGDPDRDQHLGWVRSTWQALSPYSSGGNYVNAHNGDEEEERTQAAYRDGYERLRQVKSRYDPDNFFCTNRNIPPASQQDGAVRDQIR